VAIFTQYRFNNVDSDLAVLQNIADKCVLHGWVVDKFDTTNKELYIHSAGNGYQNLYYSMKIIDSGSYKKLHIYGNTGFDTNQSFSNQPGKWTPDYTSYGGNLFTIPLITQYLFINQLGIFMALDSVLPAIFIRDISLSGRKVVLTYFGSIDSYKSNEAEGNVLFDFRTGNWYGYYNMTAYNAIFSNVLVDFGSYPTGLIYYFNSQKPVYSTITLSYKIGYVNDRVGGFIYNQAVKMNSYTNKSSLIKPIISISHSIGGYNYFFPVGELPYYAGVHYPYYTVGTEVTYGTRKFVAIPLVEYTASYGVFIEIA
jgi:hypothetical protein